MTSRCNNQIPVYTLFKWLYAVLILLFLTPVYALPPTTLNYQGYLTDDTGSPLNSPPAINITFRLYTTATGGSMIWGETQAVEVTNGLFSVELGSVTTLNLPDDFTTPLYLGIEVETDGEMLPRRVLTLTGYSIKAIDADTLDGYSASALDQSADLAAHSSNPSAHHDKTLSFTELVDQANDAQIPATITRDTELSAHASDPSAHHTKTTSFTELADQASDAQIPDSITIDQAANADTLDGLDSTAFMSSGTDNWVNSSGDVMTGNLSVLANVGIGTAASAHGLDVRGGTNNSLGYFYNDNNTDGNAEGLYVVGDAYSTGTRDGSGASFYGYGGSTSGDAIGTHNFAYAFGEGNAYGVFSVATAGPTTGREYAFYGAGDGYFSGNVGIGTDTPAYKLDVKGSISDYLGYFQNDNDTSGDTFGLYAKGNAYDTETDDGIGGNFYGVGGSSNGNAYGMKSYADAYGSSTAYGVFSNATGGTTTGKEYAFFGIGDGFFSGHVGIGTDASLFYLLNIEGNIDTAVAHFRNHNLTPGDSIAVGISATGDADDTGSGEGWGGYFYGQAGDSGAEAYGTYVEAYATGSSNAYGVYSDVHWGQTTGTKYALYGIGDAYVSGILTKGGGAFKIDHPLDPENKYLYHSFVESPDMKNVYDGVVILDNNGEATVSLPEWFEALNKDFRYQLTCIGGFAPVYIAEEISGNRFKIAGGQSGMKVSWMVTGIRQDAFANANRIPVEQDKQGIEQGTYLHPEAYGLSQERSLANARAADTGVKTSDLR